MHSSNPREPKTGHPNSSQQSVAKCRPSSVNANNASSPPFKNRRTSGLLGFVFQFSTFSRSFSQIFFAPTCMSLRPTVSTPRPFSEHRSSGRVKINREFIVVPPLSRRVCHSRLRSNEEEESLGRPRLERTINLPGVLMARSGVFDPPPRTVGKIDQMRREV